MCQWQARSQIPKRVTPDSLQAECAQRGGWRQGLRRWADTRRRGTGIKRPDSYTGISCLPRRIPVIQALGEVAQNNEARPMLGIRAQAEGNQRGE